MQRTPPVHSRVYADLEERILTGAWPVGTRLPAEPEVAAELGVSRGTLRRALARLRERGLLDGVPGRGTFVRSQSPVPVAEPRVVGVLVPSLARPFLGDLLGAIEEALHGAGYSMLVASSGFSPVQESGRARRMLKAGIAGMVSYPHDRSTTRLYRALHDDGLPLVFVDRHPPAVSADAVLPDNVTGAYGAVRHLAGLGHRRIAFVTTDNLSTTSVAERHRGYQHALWDSGLDDDPALVFSSLAVADFASHPPAGSEARVRRVLQKFLAEARPTAVFALHDRVAFEVHQSAIASGLRVPQDLSLVGFDDAAAVHALIPALTSVEQPRERIGQLAARLVIDRIEGRRREVARHVLPTRLVVRRSTAPGPERAHLAPVG